MLNAMRALASPIAAAAFAALSTLAAAPAWGSASSVLSIAESVGALIGGISTSVRRSSESSAPRPLAEGDYKIIQVAAAVGRPGEVQLTLRAAGARVDRDEPAADDWLLFVPQTLAETPGLAVGQTVAVRARPYGLELASAGRPFFLVLHDDWLRELDARPVRL